jgi:hypothetical protein
VWPGLHSEFKVSLNYTIRPCLKKSKYMNKIKNFCVLKTDWWSDNLCHKFGENIFVTYVNDDRAVYRIYRQFLSLNNKISGLLFIIIGWFAYFCKILHRHSYDSFIISLDACYSNFAHLFKSDLALLGFYINFRISLEVFLSLSLSLSLFSLKAEILIICNNLYLGGELLSFQYWVFQSMDMVYPLIRSALFFSV